MTFKTPLQYLNKKENSINDVSYHEINLFCSIKNLSYLERFVSEGREGVRFVDVERNVFYYSNEDINTKLGLRPK